MSKIREIIETYFKDIYPRNVQKKFVLWLAEKQSKQEKEAILQEIWNELDVEADVSTEESYQKLQKRIFTRAGKRKLFPLFRKLSRIAAMVFVPILSVSTVYFYFKKDISVDNDMQLIECIVPKGKMQTIILPDSSRVQLNAETILIYPQHFGKTRNVYINGEGYFSIVHNPERPFIVKTMDMEIEVLGTVFNVSSYIDSESSSTSLESGKINIRFKNQPGQCLELAPDEQITYNRILGLLEKQPVKIENAIAWTQGNLVIQSMSIEEIAKIIERKYALKVYINSNRYRDEKITMKFMNGEGINECMTVLQYLIPNLRYKIERDKLYIY
jgi:ferric-dicitrate binding protein FerR (iron transport regulator)